MWLHLSLSPSLPLSLSPSPPLSPPRATALCASVVASASKAPYRGSCPLIEAAVELADVVHRRKHVHCHLLTSFSNPGFATNTKFYSFFKMLPENTIFHT